MTAISILHEKWMKGPRVPKEYEALERNQNVVAAVVRHAAVRAQVEALMLEKSCACDRDRESAGTTLLCPSLPGCVATGPTFDAFEPTSATPFLFSIRRGFAGSGLPVPAPRASALRRS